MSDDVSGSARERLIEAALKLFAERGFSRTRVGDIEAAAGFTSRGGALYKHFGGKEQVLETAVDHVIAAAERGRSIGDLLPLGDARAEIVLLGRYLLHELNGQRDLTLVLEKEGALFPALRRRVFKDVVERGTATVSEHIATRLTEHGLQGWDADALAFILISGLVNFRRVDWTFGAVPLGVTEERVVQTLADLVAVAMNVAAADTAT